MRWVAVLGSLAIAALSAATPGALALAHPYDETARWEAASHERAAHDEDATPEGDSRSASEDDDLDERDLDERDLCGDEPLAILDLAGHDWAPLVTTTRWWLHAPSAPAAPHLELSHRPPIAG